MHSSELGYFFVGSAFQFLFTFRFHHSLRKSTLILHASWQFSTAQASLFLRDWSHDSVHIMHLPRSWPTSRRIALLGRRHAPSNRLERLSSYHERKTTVSHCRAAIRFRAWPPFPWFSAPTPQFLNSQVLSRSLSLWKFSWKMRNNGFLWNRPFHEGRTLNLAVYYSCKVVTLQRFLGLLQAFWELSLEPGLGLTKSNSGWQLLGILTDR